MVHPWRVGRTRAGLVPVFIEPKLLNHGEKKSDTCYRGNTLPDRGNSKDYVIARLEHGGKREEQGSNDNLGSPVACGLPASSSSSRNPCSSATCIATQLSAYPNLGWHWLKTIFQRNMHCDRMAYAVH